jgi:phage/plasmid primase-like uncharacterized protein
MTPIDEDPVGNPQQKIIDLNKYARQDEKPARATPAPLSQAVADFRAAMLAGGLAATDVIPDGRLHRCNAVDEPNARRKMSGWYKLNPDGNIPAGAFGSWAHGTKETWSSKPFYEMSTEEARATKEFFRKAKAEAEADRQAEAEAAAARAKQIFDAASEATEHPYLARKGVAAFGVRVDKRGELLIPMYDRCGDVRGLQRILADGQKRFLQGQANSGLFHAITSSSPDASRTVYVCEGYATGASLHMATGETVLIAFNSNGLGPVGEAAQEVFPGSKIVFAADNDRWTQVNGSPKNVGIEAARKAAAPLGATVIWPEFRDLSTHPSDFNDLYALEGPDSVRAQAKGYVTNVRDWSIGRLEGCEVPERHWLVDQMIPQDSALLLAAPGGTGKGMTLLDLAIKVASGPTQGIDLNASAGFFGHDILAYGPVVYLAAEDDQGEVHRRINTIAGRYPENLYVLCLPDMEGLQAMVVEGRDGPRLTDWWHELVAQMRIIRPALFIMDPLACFVWAELNDRQVGAFVMGTLSHLARQLHASVIVAHHMNKLNEPLKDLDAAKAKISGSAGFVDHGRGSIVLWPEEESRARKLCKQLGVEYARGKIIRGGLAKNNFLGDNEEKTFIRDENGLLIPMDHGARIIAARKQGELLDLLEKVIAHAAVQGHPFQHKGRQGLYEKRERLPETLREMGRDSLERLGRILLDEKRIDKYRPGKGGSIEQWLDIPGGPFALGTGILEPGEYENVSE